MVLEHLILLLHTSEDFLKHFTHPTEQKERKKGKEMFRSLHLTTSRKNQDVPTIPVSPKAPIIEEPPRGRKLQRHHMQTVIICLWVLCIIAYIAAIEKAIYAHSQLSPTDQALVAVGKSFGERGTRRRQETVQIFSFARTVLTAVHVCPWIMFSNGLCWEVPIITGTLATTLPILTQRTRGRTPPKLNAEQLFLLADRTWAGAGGWYEAFRVGRMSWEWWKLTFIVLASFAGFPFVTMGYIATSDQFWAAYEFNGINALRFNNSMETIRSGVTAGLDGWMHRFPQRELGMTLFQQELTQKDANGKSLFSFYPPADPRSAMGHFITFLQPLDAEPRLVVANTMGVVQNLGCRTLKKGETPRFIDMSKNAWRCRNDCANSTQPSMCHSQASVGRKDPNSDQFSQVVTCAQQTDSVEGIANPAILKMAQMIAFEIAIKFDPPYESVSSKIFPLPENAFSFRANDSISGTRYYVDVLTCEASLIPGEGIVDSVIKKFMHFIPYGLGLAQEPPSIMESLPQSLTEMLNITITPPLTLLHQHFKSSNYANNNNNNNNLNNSLPVWFGVQKPGDEAAKTTKVYNYIPTAKQPFTPLDQYKIDNTIRITGETLHNAFISLANSSFISALPNFVETTMKPGFSYQTDVKLVRGIPIAVGPVILLLPVLLVAYWSIRLWAVPTWTEFLDSFAMFRLGRAWEVQMDGCGASKLRECWQVREISGIVGDSESEKVKEVVQIAGKEYVGTIKLGGAQSLAPGVRYA